MAGSDYRGTVDLADPVRDRACPPDERHGSRSQTPLHPATRRRDRPMTRFVLPTIAPGFSDLVSKLDRRRMWKHLDIFDRWTKYSGSHEQLESPNYVEAEMKAYWLATRLILHDAYISIPGKA